MNLAIDRIALDWISSGLQDQLLDLFDAQAFGSRCTCIVIDQFVADRSIDVVGSVG